MVTLPCISCSSHRTSPQVGRTHSLICMACTAPRAHVSHEVSEWAQRCRLAEVVKLAGLTNHLINRDEERMCPCDYTEMGLPKSRLYTCLLSRQWNASKTHQRWNVSSFWDGLLEFLAGAAAVKQIERCDRQRCALRSIYQRTVSRFLAMSHVYAYKLRIPVVRIGGGSCRLRWRHWVFRHNILHFGLFGNARRIVEC